MIFRIILSAGIVFTAFYFAVAFNFDEATNTMNETGMLVDWLLLMLISVLGIAWWTALAIKSKVDKYGKGFEDYIKKGKHDERQ